MILRATAVFFIFIFLAVPVSFSQGVSSEAIAAGKGFRLTAGGLRSEARQSFENVRNEVAKTRTQILSNYLAELLLEAEAKARGITVEELEAAEMKKVPDPATKEIQAVYDTNRGSLGGRSLEEVRPAIVNFLRRETEQKAFQALIDSLQKKHGLVKVKDVNASDIKPVDIIARIGTRTVLYREFEEKYRFRLADTEEHIYEDLHLLLEEEVMAVLVGLEAAERKTNEGSVIAAEITNKMRDFSDEERADLEDAFQRRLFSKYEVKYLYPRPEPLVQNISAEGPSIGNPNAPVTVVMFSDYQCPACARAHPVLKRVMAEYGDRVRLVVRDFPLENVHENAFSAARAANAADAQGKFVEFIELLYRNQDSLDDASLEKYAAQAGLDIKRFETDIKNASAADKIRKDIADGRSYGVLGTPTIFVNGIKVHRLSAPAFRDAIERALKK